jgi:hypothetical protein
MKKVILSLLFYFIAVTVFSQKINGQWRGYFNSQGDIVINGAGNTEYVLELEIKGTKVNGFSYSYFEGRRYYVICKLDGVYYPASKSIKVIETERVKGNTRPDFQDCFQVHYLTYKKEGGVEELDGRWVTRPNQPGSGCGDGSTTLIRKTLDKSLSQFNKKSTQQPVAKKPAQKTNNTVAKAKPAVPKANTSIAKTTVKPPATKAKTPIAKATEKPVTQIMPPVAKAEPIAKDPDDVQKPEAKKMEITGIKTDMNFEKRKADVLKTIQIENDNFRVDLYDNGEVDGDSISVFYNSKLILSHKRLSEKPITLTLNTPDGDDINELTMYAENLGEIAPNTALMVVTDGDKRYEVRISSDLKNSGTIRFIHKPKNPQ